MCMSPCSDGMGRTGAFICLHARLKTEGVIDCFQVSPPQPSRPGAECGEFVGECKQ